MENTEMVCILKHEKLKLHVKYVIAIAAILSLGSVILAAYDQEAFTGQVAFGATLTSIVLSVIAIWMSISGERTTNDIRIKIAESTERLSKTTKEIETLNSNYEKTMDSQINELKNVQEQLTQITNSVSNVEKQVSAINEKDTSAPKTADNSMMDTNQKITLFNNTYSWITSEDSEKQWIFCKMVELIINKLESPGTFNFGDILEQLTQIDLDTQKWTPLLYIYWGSINTLTIATVLNDEEAKKKIKEITQNKLAAKE